ncbi:hypothetical protein SAMN05443575_3110 [Jatrophihabitans endophyticus]|uniref:Uncharacterized protein n=1 Tax=Jatrophihabitans endophyticus TaxID=1206085 RepID=A0A1M5PLI2_9ACTN|nr:hypothetical protein [Jatrophihabitans endophyticus]SHH02103.1 hypothetical protein SAMN05443575_3110 [Jatrophihabitans endophyticus]
MTSPQARPFSASTNKLAYAQAFATTTTRRRASHRPLRSFVRRTRTASARVR